MTKQSITFEIVAPRRKFKVINRASVKATLLLHAAVAYCHRGPKDEIEKLRRLLADAVEHTNRPNARRHIERMAMVIRQHRDKPAQCGNIVAACAHECTLALAEAALAS